MFNYEWHQRIVNWLKESRHKVFKSFEEDVAVGTKRSRRDLVTEMDQALEKSLIECIRQMCPSHRIISEEGYGDDVQDESGYIWTIDPIDGTANYVKQQDNFGTMIGLFHNGEPLAGYLYTPVNDKLIYGIVGKGAFINETPLVPLLVESLADSFLVTNNEFLLRNDLNLQAIHQVSFGSRAYGASIMEFMALIEGKASAYVMSHLKVWDFAAGWAICEAMGITCSTAEGNSPLLLKGSSIVVAQPDIHQEVLTMIQE